MKIHTSFDNKISIKNPVITTGSFDGVHIGHKTIINRLNKLAKSINGESVLITFHPHPRKVLYPEKFSDLQLINTQREKKELLAKTGLDHLFVINFTIDFSKTTSYKFVNNILLDKINAKIIVVGFNHHFGHNREGDYEYLYELSKKKNFTVEEIPQQDIENEAVSSTRIRKALKNGHIQRANASLDNHFIMSGKLIYTDNISPDQNVSAIRLMPEEDVKLIPPEGVYAVTIALKNTLSKSMVIIGADNNEKKIYIPDLFKDLDTNKEFCKIFFQKRIRCGNVLLDKNLNNTLKKDKEKISELIF